MVREPAHPLEQLVEVVLAEALVAQNETDIRMAARHVHAVLGQVHRRGGRRVRAITDSLPREKLLQPPGFEGHYDPHVWFDVELWSGCIETVVAELSSVRPDDRAVFEAAQGLREVGLSYLVTYCDQLIEGKVERFELPNLGALNFLCYGALGGGGTLSLRIDAQGKTIIPGLMDNHLHNAGGGPGVDLSRTRSLDEVLSHQPVHYFSPDDPRGRVDQLHTPELRDAATRPS